MKTVVEAWRARPERERSLLGAGALVVGVMLYVALVWLPLERTRVRLAADLPTLRASIAALERDAAEVKRLRAIPSAIPRNQMPLASLMSMNAWAKQLPGVQVTAAARVTGRTGVEMEALTAVAVACLTVYDMVKAVDKGMVIQDVKLVSKAKRPAHGS